MLGKGLEYYVIEFLVYTGHLLLVVDLDSLLGVPTRYGLDGLRIEPWWDEIYNTRPHWPLNPHNLI
jgi:hypothetical protein